MTIRGPLSNREKAEMLGAVALAVWEAYPDETVEVGTQIMWSGYYAPPLMLRLRFMLDDENYFAARVPVEHHDTPQKVAEKIFDCVLEEGPGWSPSR